MKITKIKHVISDKMESFYDVINCLPFNNFPIVTNSSRIISHNCAFMD